jgi:hypothetical protein
VTLKPRAQRFVQPVVFSVASNNGGVDVAWFLKTLSYGADDHGIVVPFSGCGKIFFCTPKRPERLWRPVLLFSGARSALLVGNVTDVKPTISSESKIRMTGAIYITPRT